MNMKCNCGKPGRYSHFQGDVEVLSCNKHIVCPTYNELVEHMESLKTEIRELNEEITLYDLAVVKEFGKKIGRKRMSTKSLINALPPLGFKPFQS